MACRLLRLVCVSLPSYGSSRALHAANEDAARTALASLLSLLADWESNPCVTVDSEDPSYADTLPELQLSVQFYLDEDLEYNGDGPTDQGFETSSSVARQYISLRAEHEHEASLPSVQRVDGLILLEAHPSMALYPPALCQLAAAFPRLNSLDLQYLDPAVKRRERRREYRLALANGVGSLR